MIPLRDSHPAGRFPFWVVAIIAINIYAFFLELASPNPDLFIAIYGLVPSLVDPIIPATWVPFITSQFLHGGFIHIISNMVFLWVFGDNVEEKIGILTFPLFYLGAGVVGGLSQYFVAPDSQIPMIGASGAVAGVLGVYFALFGHHTVKTLVPLFGFFSVIDVPASVMLFYWFITQLFSGAASITFDTTDLGGVAFMAHVGGFAFGWIVAQFYKKSA